MSFFLLLLLLSAFVVRGKIAFSHHTCTHSTSSPSVNELTSQMALQAMDALDSLQGNIRALLQEREIVAAALNELDFVEKVFPSDANFLLFRLQKNAQAVYKHMADNGVVTRYRGNELHCSECIRVTVGTPEENKAFLEALKSTYEALS